MTDDNNNITSVTRRSRFKYGFWVIGVILGISAAVWGFQRFLISPNSISPPKELVWHNDLKIDLRHPDVLIESESLSRLPKDLLTIPFLHDTLTEDFVFYYQNNADRLGITGSLRRIIFEHELTLRDNLLETLLDQPANIALWHDERGRLDRFMAVIKLSGLARLLEPLVKIAADDTQLARMDFAPLKVGNEAISVYQLRYGVSKPLLFASYGDNLLLFSDLAMLYDQQTPSQESSEVISALLNGDTLWQQSFALKTHDAANSPASGADKTAHRISISANYLGFGYQRFVPAFAGVRFEMQPQGWASYLALNDASTAENAAFDFSPIWKTMPMGASLCLALPVSHSVPEYLLQRIDTLSDEAEATTATSLTMSGASGLCWYPDSHLYTPLIVSRLETPADEQIDTKLATLFATVIGAREKQPVPVLATRKNQAHLWQRDVSSRYGQYPASESGAAQNLVGSRFFRVSLARHDQTLLFSLDDQLVNKALQTLDKNFPPIADVLPAQGVVSAYMAPEALSGLLKQEAFASLPKNVEPIFYNAAQTHLLPKLSALAGQRRYALVLPADTQVKESWQWLPLQWQGL
ncbi:uncharacterized protein YfaA (DUF2138 family) [Serratia fonticola]|uniref:Uncharacterized protein YfaA (DUF2138 family) n=1 Tax=Serratia fonticola TaxID=47917 RepID=A0A542BTX9_SERFO|nr:DUF2138 domain-containing protein [Serratia fonticola]TQI82012.1 uncharacterized protein YfaA (DUF2138 family) [Serratia fonticola]TQI95965.1 uncharacterized protein YfaA (DUF2138 family) [Serratia fonticola]TVZ70462.1 uncharacterized protein YfaA (DUF2138 family) [Serratia fonticola]